MGPAGFGDEGFAQPRASAEVDFLEPHPGLDAYYQRWDATRELMNRKLRKDLMNLTAERTAAARAKAQVFDEVTRNATLRLEPEEWRLRSEQQRLRNQLAIRQPHHLEGGRELGAAAAGGARGGSRAGAPGGGGALPSPPAGKGPARGRVGGFTHAVHGFLGFIISSPVSPPGRTHHAETGL